MNSNFTKSIGKQKSYYDILNENPKFQEMKELYEAMEKLNEGGTDLDIMPEGFGEFGHDLTNPIPVNTIMGSISYLSKLRTMDGIKVEYERAGSLSAPNIKRIIDRYKISANGEKIATLFICPYNKKNSEKAPKGFKIASFV
jgi:hypothetical protein